MPWLILGAIVATFLLDPAEGSVRLTSWQWRTRLVVATLGPIVTATVAWSFGRYVQAQLARSWDDGRAARRLFRFGSRIVEWFGLVVYACVLHFAHWPSVVRDGFGLRDWILVDDLAIFAPFVLIELAGWAALHRAERVCRASLRDFHPPGLGRALILKTRLTMGLVLPVAMIFWLGQDLARLFSTSESIRPWVQLGWMTLTGGVVLILAPAFVRLSWPSRRLPEGPLRTRLERLSRRFGYRCGEILVWETGGVFINAAVTGTLPWFRHVLLTDALVDLLPDHEIEAVFGHELGHIVHRHLAFFGLFFVGSMGFLALAAQGINRYFVPGSAFVLGYRGESTVGAFQSVTALICVVVYFALFFGFLSRRFERQADVFGCLAVSCSLEDCPPHLDVNADVVDPNPPVHLCPFGIRTFADALENVARLNGFGRTAYSWRHGRIADRIAFLETLVGRPDLQSRFQSGLLRLRLGFFALLVLAVWLAASSGAFEAF